MQIPILKQEGAQRLAAGVLDLKHLPGFSHCPVCNRLFEPAHAARKPKYCEGCGFALRWEEQI